MITQQEYNDLIQQGFQPQEIMEADKELDMQQKGLAPTQQMIPAPFAPITMNQQSNIVEWQLDLDKEKERIFHLLRGDEVREDKKGNKIWVKNTKRRILNDYGVAEVMRILDFWLSKNKILSDYDEVTINERVLDFGRAISNLFFMKYEKMGLKRKNYSMLVISLWTSVEDTYRRALRGGERRSLREARQITQTEQVGQNNQIPMAMGKPRGVLNPARIFGSKYKY